MVIWDFVVQVFLNAAQGVHLCFNQAEVNHKAAIHHFIAQCRLLANSRQTKFLHSRRKTVF